MKNNEIYLNNEVILVLKNYCIFGFLWLFFGFLPTYVFSYYELSINSILFSFLNAVILYFIFLNGFILFSFASRRSYNFIVNSNLSKIIYFLLFLYYFILVLRFYFIADTEVYGFRFFNGFVFPFWILCPLFVFNIRYRFNLFLCIFCCLLEVVFWYLFYSVNSTDHKEKVLPAYIFFSTIIFVVLFPFFSYFLEKTGVFNIVKKSKNKKISSISKIISLVMIFLGGVFILLFYLTF